MVNFDIVNVVATACLDQELDFYELWKLKEIFYDSDVHGGRVAYFKTKDMEGRVALFSSGKMISLGTRSEKRAFAELRQAMSFLVQKGLIKKVKLCPTTRNIVVTADYQRRINLEQVAARARGVYETGRFPAYILRVDKPHKATILIFPSGKVVITGLKSSEHISYMKQMLGEIL